MNNHLIIYKPLVEAFCEETKKYKNSIKLQGLFLPHGLINYEKANKKYFYVGRDTTDWGTFEKLIDDYEKNRIEEYIDDINDLDDYLGYANNKAGGFWTLVGKLHLKLHGVNESISINTELETKYKDILSEMGYGNLNSIETPQNLINKKAWGSINQDIYWDIKSKSRIFDKLKFIIEIYKPDYIFIFNWTEDEEYEELAFSDLNVECLKEEHKPNLISTYIIKPYGTKIIWTIHPRRLSFIGMNIDDIIKLILERVKW